MAIFKAQYVIVCRCPEPNLYSRWAVSWNRPTALNDRSSHDALCLNQSWPPFEVRVHLVARGSSAHLSGGMTHTVTDPSCSCQGDRRFLKTEIILPAGTGYFRRQPVCLFLDLSVSYPDNLTNLAEKPLLWDTSPSQTPYPSVHVPCTQWKVALTSAWDIIRWSRCLWLFELPQCCAWICRTMCMHVVVAVEVVDWIKEIQNFSICREPFRIKVS